jgi:hypothetical protein
MFVAPSGKTYDTLPATPADRGLSTTLRFHNLFSEGCPHGSHDCRGQRNTSVGIEMARRAKTLRAQQNAQRNLDFVASTSDASTFGVAFDFVAPSGKTYITARPSGCLPGYPRVSKFAAGS